MNNKFSKSFTKGRGALSNQGSRFVEYQYEPEYDDWPLDKNENRRTEVFIDSSKTIITRNQSPDVPFDRSINPYKGCEHGCVYP